MQRNDFDPFSYVDTIKNNFLNDKKNSFYTTRINLFSLKKSNLRALATHLFDVLKNCDEDLYQIYTMALDVINTRIYIPPDPKVKRKPLSIKSRFLLLVKLWILLIFQRSYVMIK